MMFGLLGIAASSCALAAGIDGLRVSEAEDAAVPVSTGQGPIDAASDRVDVPPDTSTTTQEAGACDFLTQAGCRSTETCYYGSPNFCQTAGGKRTLWQGCLDDPSACGPGLVCLLNVCVPQCDVPDKKCQVGDDAGAATVCVGYVGLTNVGTCWKTCDPTSTSGCGGLTSGRTCLVIASHAVCGTHRLATNGGTDASCKDNADCASGYWCIGDKCVRRCALSGGGMPCSSGQTCKGFASPFLADGVSLGYCSAP